MTSCTILVISLLTMLTCTLSPSLQAQDKNDAFTVVSHIDIIPSIFMKGSEESAARLLRAQESASLHDIGLLAFSIFQQEAASNHFTIVETWRNRQSYLLHEGQTHTVQFRNGIQPFLGGPIDVREHHLLR